MRPELPLIPSGSFARAPWPQLLLVCTIASPLIAWVAVSMGLGLPTSDPLRDLMLLVVGAAAEEIVFRGGIQPALARHPWGRQAWCPWPQWRWLSLTQANLWTSVLFALLHLWRHPALAALAVFPVSLLLGLSVEWSQRLRVPVVLHLWFNLSLWSVSFLNSPA